MSPRACLSTLILNMHPSSAKSYKNWCACFQNTIPSSSISHSQSLLDDVELSRQKSPWISLPCTRPSWRIFNSIFPLSTKMYSLFLPFDASPLDSVRSFLFVPFCWVSSIHPLLFNWHCVDDSWDWTLTFSFHVSFLHFLLCGCYI